MEVSMINAFRNAIGVIDAVNPVTNKMLNMLLPTMLPMARPVFPLRAAVTDVTNSGRDVPKATMVSAIMRWLTPRSSAISLAPYTMHLLPKTIIARPRMVQKIIHRTLSKK